MKSGKGRSQREQRESQVAIMATYAVMSQLVSETATVPSLSEVAPKVEAFIDEYMSGIRHVFNVHDTTQAFDDLIRDIGARFSTAMQKLK